MQVLEKHSGSVKLWQMYIDLQRDLQLRKHGNVVHAVQSTTAAALQVCHLKASCSAAAAGLFQRLPW